ncbi:MAG: hypothetical protein LBR70_01850 [Lactobacillaceae bacterium]|jgi:hypothetical protein|nr:hypothetical protein [Lactobacillaceae bacterium]
MKKLFVLVLCVLISACASNLAVKSDNPAEATFKFKTPDNDAVLTFWRRIEPDGLKSSRFSVGVPTATLAMNGTFPRYYEESVQLDAGTYYLDSFQIPVSSTEFCVSQGGHYMLRNGWDDENNNPYYLSFTVKDGEKAVLPLVTMETDCETASFSDPNKRFTVGSRLSVK